MATYCLRVAVWLWSLWNFLFYFSAAFNLDVQDVLRRDGQKGSLFGFSLALHQQMQPANKKLLLVGAPRAKTHNQANVTGVVYQCGLMTTSEGCQPIGWDNNVFLGSQGINNQWMGVRVTSQGPGQNVMACAHRYQQWNPSPTDYIPHLLTGQCYLLGEDLHTSKAKRTWRRVVCDGEHLNRRHMNNEWFAYCQQGHGASFAKDNRSLLIGAPGAYQWKGIVRMELVDNLVLSNEEPRETGDTDRFDPSLIPLHNTSYLGFSLDSGMALTRKNQLTIVSGAPRGGYSGQVAFIKADPFSERGLTVDLVLSGPGLASSFGYDLAVVDLNGDGWEDLAVGAPEFFLKDGDVGGAVYVYINDKGTENQRHWDKIQPIPLHGHKDSMFGLAVASIGDVNQDSYGDIAVGAPYDGPGQVYLYYGCLKGIHEKPAQILSPGSNGISRFGYSLSGNLDVDDNHYPDLAVGSLSDSVFVYRARPVITISKFLKITPNEVDITKEHCNVKRCQFTALACFTYTARPSSFNPRLTLHYVLDSDAERKKLRLPSRVDFLGLLKGTLELPGQGREVCTETKLQLLRDIGDKLHNISVSVSESLLASSQTEAQSALPELTPVLNIYQPKDATAEITLINKGCGSDNICQSNLQLQYNFCQKQLEKNVFNSLHRDSGIAVITPSEEDIALELTVTNMGGDDAHQCHLKVMLPPTLRYHSIYLSEQKAQVKCKANNNGTLIDCELGNPLQRDGKVVFYIILSTVRVSLSTTDVNVTLQLETTSVQDIPPTQALARVEFVLQLQVFGRSKPAQVYLSGESRGESAIKREDEIGALVEYEFTISNLGRPLKSFAKASLNIYWPKETAAGKWLLYLVQTSSRGMQSVPCSPAQEISPLKDIKGWHNASRKRREAEQQAIAIPFFTAKRNYKTLTCSDELKCVEIRCPLVGLNSYTAVVSLQSRLWDSTLIEDYSSLNYLDIVVNATLSLIDAPENIELKTVNQKLPKTLVKLTVFPEKKAVSFTKVAWWIIFLTVLMGLLFLAAHFLLLWKCGCITCPTKNPNKHKET